MRISDRPGSLTRIATPEEPAITRPISPTVSVPPPTRCTAASAPPVTMPFTVTVCFRMSSVVESASAPLSSPALAT